MSDSEMRELDAWIAEHVMNWLMHENGRGSLVAIQGFNTPTETNRVIIAKHPWDACEWSPTTDPAAAMEVLRKCSQKATVTIEVSQSGDRAWVSRLENDANGYLEENHCKCAPTLELAICIFARELFSK